MGDLRSGGHLGAGFVVADAVAVVFFLLDELDECDEHSPVFDDCISWLGMTV